MTTSPRLVAALTILALLAVVVLLREGRSVLIPIVLSVLASYALEPAVSWLQRRSVPRLAGTTVNDNMADPDHIAETYLQLYRQHRSTWAFEVVLRPWLEKW